MQTLKTFYYQAKQEYAVSAAAPTGKVLIKEAKHPTSVNVNVEFEWYVVGHVEDGVVHNPGVAYVYVDGPASNIVLVKTDGSEINLPKGNALILYYHADKDVCTDIDSRNVFKGAKFPNAGTYTIWLLSGYLTEDEAAMGRATFAGLSELLTRHIKNFAGYPVTVTVPTTRLATSLIPIALGSLALLLATR